MDFCAERTEINWQIQYFYADPWPGVKVWRKKTFSEVEDFFVIICFKHIFGHKNCYFQMDKKRQIAHQNKTNSFKNAKQTETGRWLYMWIACMSNGRNTMLIWNQALNYYK